MKKVLLIAVAAMALMGCSKCSKNEPVQTKAYTYEEYYALREGRLDSLYVSIAVDFPVAMQNNDVLPSVQRQIKSEIFGDAYQDMEIQQAIEAYTAMLKTEYKQNNMPLVEERENALTEMIDAIYNEEQIISTMVIAVHKDIMSYAVERYVFMGGAHGSNYRIFYNFDLKTGELLHEKDLFVEGFETPMTELLLKNIVAQNEDFQLIEDLEEYGYNVDEIMPNDNFFLTDSALVYVFNQYEIAPYALGETEIAVSYDQLKDLLLDKERL